jgi:tetratricopeptide (TPR) repeat protein/predicted Ser/Thr protein kinase
VGEDERAPLLGRGATVGRYVVVDRIGEGGMGVVYKAYDPELERGVALKLLKVQDRDGTARDRLLREARALAKLSHPAVVTIHDVGTFGDDVFIATELVDGDTLREWLRMAARRPSDVLRLFLAAGEGLAAAHRAELIHRDFKPENVIVGVDGRVRVIDFGLARVATAPAPPASPVSPTSSAGIVLPGPGGAPPDGASLDLLTVDGEVLGTPAYMAPEQRAGARLDARTDQFSFCVALYEALYGARPFASQRERETDAGQVDPPPPRTRVPRWLRAVLLRGLAPAADARFPSMDALLSALRRDPRGVRLRWALATAGALLVAALASGIHRAQGDGARVCRGALGELAGAWDPARDAAVRAAFLATGVPYAGAAHARVESAFDAYASAWRAARLDACEATRVRGEQSDEMLDLRMGCLAQARAGLAAQTEIFMTADADVVARAVQASRALPSIAACSDVAALRAPLRPPASPEARARVQMLREKIARARALNAAGRYTEGLALVGQVAAGAAPLHYPPLDAETSLARADLEEGNGTYAEAVASANEAIVAAEEGGHAEIAARAWTVLVWLEGLRLVHFDEAIAASRHAQAIIARLGRDDLLVAELQRSLGATYLRKGDLVRAGEAYELAYRLRRRVMGDADPKVAECLSDLGDVARAQARYPEALDLYRRTATIWATSLGDEHPDVGAARNNVGIVLLRLGRYDEALAEHEQALALWERSLGPDHPHVGEALTDISEVYRVEHRFDRAEEYDRRVLVLDERGGDGNANATYLAADHMNLGEAYLGQKRTADALAEFERGRAIAEAAEGPDHRDVAIARVGIGDAHLAEGRLDDAMAAYERALSSLRHALGDAHPDLAAPLLGIARVHLARRAPALAVAPATDAVALRAKDASDPHLLAEARVVLARALWGAGKGEDTARNLTLGAREVLVADAYGAAGVAEIDALLALHRR